MLPFPYFQLQLAKFTEVYMVTNNFETTVDIFVNLFRSNVPQRSPSVNSQQSSPASDGRENNENVKKLKEKCWDYNGRNVFFNGNRRSAHKSFKLASCP